MWSLVQVYSKLAEGVERMAWLERYLPSSMAQRFSDRLARASQWARGLAGGTASQGSQVCGGHHSLQHAPHPLPTLPSGIHTPFLPSLAACTTPPPSPTVLQEDAERATYRRPDGVPGARERKLERDNSALLVSAPVHHTALLSWAT